MPEPRQIDVAPVCDQANSLFFFVKREKKILLEQICLLEVSLGGNGSY